MPNNKLPRGVSLNFDIADLVDQIAKEYNVSRSAVVGEFILQHRGRLKIPKGRLQFYHPYRQQTKKRNKR